MRKPLLVLLLLGLVITAKAQQDDKPTKAEAGQTANTAQQTTPEPAGGVDAFMKYVKKIANREYNNSVTGEVSLSFVVGTDGSLTGYKIEKSLNKEADGIAIDVVKDYGKKWKPAMQNGQPVPAVYTMLVPFGI